MTERLKAGTRRSRPAPTTGRGTCRAAELRPDKPGTDLPDGGPQRLPPRTPPCVSGVWQFHCPGHVQTPSGIVSIALGDIAPGKTFGGTRTDIEGTARDTRPPAAGPSPDTDLHWLDAPPAARHSATFHQPVPAL